MFDKEKIEELPIHSSDSSTGRSALDGLKVVDFSHFLAGPLASMFLADFGADVIKVEPPVKGEDFRYYPPQDPALPAQGAPYLWANRNKRSIALDLKTDEGVRVARDLIAKADVLIENFSTGVMQRFGLGYDDCARLNPRLVYCSVSAYGREGPFADRLGFDPIAQAESGFIAANGYPDRPGVRAASPVMDIATAMMASNAMLMALLSRERTGKGQQVEVALYDTAILMTGFAAMQNLVSGYQPQRNGNTSPDTCPSGVFSASDRLFYINCGNDKIFARLFAEVLERPDVACDPGLARSTGRLARRDELFRILDEAFPAHPWNHWQARLRAAAVPHGEVRTLGEALNSDEVRTRALISRIAHPILGWIPNIASPLRLAGTPAIQPCPAPSIGQHTQEILCEVLGYRPAQIEELGRAGAFGPSPALG